MADIRSANIPIRRVMGYRTAGGGHVAAAVLSGITHAGVAGADDAMPAVRRANDHPSHPAARGPASGTAHIQMHALPRHDHGREGRVEAVIGNLKFANP